MARSDRQDWHFLPDSCFERILSDLPPASQGSCRLVCRAWRTQVASTITSLRPSSHIPDGLIASTFPALKCLTLENGGTSGLGSLFALRALTQLSQLTQLTLGGEESFPGNLTLDLGPKELELLADIPCLASLSLHRLTLHLAVPELHRLSSRLKALHLHGVRFSETFSSENKISSVVDLASLTCLRALEHLTIGNVVLGQAPTLDFSQVAPLTPLRSLAIHDGVQLCNSLCHQVASLPHLEVLELCSPEWRSLRGPVAITEEGVAALCARAGTLHRLRLNGSIRLTDGCLSHINALASLTSLELDGADAATGSMDTPSLTDATSRWLSDLDNLQALRLRRWPVGPETCRVICSLPHLTRLELPNSNALTNTALFSLAAIPLRHLDIHECSRVTNLGISAISKGRASQHLTYLNLSSLRTVTNVGFKALHTLRNLRSLDVSWGVVSDAGLLSLLPSFPLLETFECADTVITDCIIEALAKHCTQLRKLNVEYCQEVTDKGAAMLCMLRCLEVVKTFGSDISYEGTLKIRTDTGARVARSKVCWWGKGGKVHS